MGVLNTFLPGGGGFEHLFARGVGNSPIKKMPGAFARGDGQAWNLLIHKLL